MLLPGSNRLSTRAHRSLLVLIAALFLCSQLGAVSHSLHVENQKSEVKCAFCLGSAHLHSTPFVAAVSATLFVPVADATVVHHVCDAKAPLTSRVTRGPPTSCLDA
jgi:hypothetical protein